MSKWRDEGHSPQSRKWWWNKSWLALLCQDSKLFVEVPFPVSSLYHFLPIHKILVPWVRAVRTIGSDDPTATRKVVWVWILFSHQSVSSGSPKLLGEPEKCHLGQIGLDDRSMTWKPSWAQPLTPHSFFLFTHTLKHALGIMFLICSGDTDCDTHLFFFFLI